MTSTITAGCQPMSAGGIRFDTDGGHKHDRFITNTLGQYVTFVPVCPGGGMRHSSIPRESMRLVGSPSRTPRLITRKSQIDYTDQMVEWGRQRIRELEKEDLCGFIFKSGSP